MEREISYGKLIKEHRKVLDLTQAELARRVGCATITLRKIEADSLRPSVQIAERLAMALKIPLEERADFVRLARAATLKTPSPPPTPTPPPLPEEIGDEDLSGRAIQGYALGERIGTGGFGAVYRATQPVLEREVAVKIILPEYADQPDFIRRFEAEAQLVARLEHPHIVPLYDYWREPGAAYLVMRLLRGGSLQRTLQDGPVGLNNFMRMLKQICLALYAAHRFGVIHRDIKPANILLDEDENAYLADFGIAKNLGNPDLEEFTQIGAMVGSPAYVSPEQIRSELVKPQADIYCLGVLTFEMLTGEQPFQGPTPIDYIQQHLTEPFPPLAKYNPDLPPALDPVILRATAKDPADRYPDVLSMLTDVQEVVSGVMDVSAGVAMLEASALEAADIENPYKGLRAFSEVDAADFFGRETLIQELMGFLAEEDDLARFLAVVGPSGSGKSSVVKAGLIPALRRGGLPGSESWFVVDFMPGGQPMEELEAALLRVAVNPPESLLGQLQESERGLLRAVQRILPPNNNVELVLVIDQFEEVFTLITDETVRAHFLESLVTAVLDPRSRLRVIITLRADFTDKPLQYVDFGELVRQRTEFVLPLTPDELELAITGPARRVGLVLEPGLVNHIIRDVGDQPGALPLLQYALTELFERRDGRLLTSTIYQSISGVLGALGRRAEEVYGGLDKTGKDAARQLFLRLVTLGEGVEDTRRRVLRSELESLFKNQQSSIRKAIDSFGQARLLTFDRDLVTRGPTVEVAHEALLNEWRRLREWLDESRADIRMQRVLGNAAAEWLEAGRDAGFLLRGSRLDQFEAWVEGTDLALTADEVSFLDASLEERRARQAAEAERQAREVTLERRSRNFLRGLVVVLALAAIVAVVLSAVAFQQRQAARKQAGILLASQAESEIENGFTDRAILLALEALENYPYTSQAEHALGQAVTNNKALQRYAGHTASVTGAAWSSDGKSIATSSTDNSVHIWDPSTGENIRVIQLPEGITGNIYDWALAVRWSPDDRYLLTVSGDRFLLGSQEYELILWDANTGEQIAVVEVENATPPAAGEGIGTSLDHFATGAGAAFASDGRLATLGGDNTALVWGLKLEDQLLVLRGHTDGVNGIDWSPDFQRLVTASEDGTARIWNADSGEEIMQLVGHDGGVNQAAWSPDGNLVATAGDDGSLRIWEAASGENLTAIQVTSSTGSTTPVDLIVWSLAWSPDGRYLATGTGDGYIRVWEVESEQKLLEMKGHDQFVTYLAWSPEDDRLVSAGADGHARIWKTSPDNMVLSLPYGFVTTGGWTPDGEYFTVGTGAGPDFSHTGMVAAWDINSRSPIYETHVDRDGKWEWMTEYSPDGQLILARTMLQWPDMTDANKFYVLDSQTGEVLRKLETGKDTIALLPGWSPDGQLAAAGDIEGTIYFWEVGSGEIIRTMNCLSWGHIVRWSPDGSKIAMNCVDFNEGKNQIRVLDSKTYESLTTIEGDIEFDVYTWFNWSPDSTRIVVAGGSDEIGTLNNPIYIFEADSGKELLKIIRHTGQVSAADWSPDGKRVVSSSTDGTTRIWDSETGAELLTLSTPGNWWITPDWSPDGHLLLVSISNTVSPGQSGVWRVWQSTQELIEYAKECCVFRELTPEEREVFGLPER